MAKKKARITITIPRRLYNILLDIRCLYASDNHPEGNMSAAISDIIKEWAETELYTKKLEAVDRLRYNLIIKRDIAKLRLQEETNK